MNVILSAFLLTTFAGLSTGIGSAIPFFFKSFKKGLLAFFLGLSAGVMILVSFMELLPKALEDLESYWVFLSFFAGMAVVAAIDFIIPHEKNPHHMTKDCESIESIQDSCADDSSEEEKIIKTRVSEEVGEESTEMQNKKLTRTGVLTALAIAIHNFPEGIATFATALDDISLGITIAIAIAIHNIPEGISVSIPIYYATKSKWKSFGLSFGSGIAEPIGAAIAYAILGPFLNATILAISLASVAGIMVYISIDELIPVAHEYGKGDLVIAGVVIGMIIMAGSLVLFEFF
ncbi:MAG TPA: zinc transporter ZupT [candidate division Zixibacteria bacterium]|nr:zinc transporter ZupT [candidate division Zixibacteria bacterium]